MNLSTTLLSKKTLRFDSIKFIEFEWLSGLLYDLMALKVKYISLIKITCDINSGWINTISLMNFSLQASTVCALIISSHFCDS